MKELIVPRLSIHDLDTKNPTNIQRIITPINDVIEVASRNSDNWFSREFRREMRFYCVNDSRRLPLNHAKIFAVCSFLQNYSDWKLLFNIHLEQYGPKKIIHRMDIYLVNTKTLFGKDIPLLRKKKDVFAAAKIGRDEKKIIGLEESFVLYDLDHEMQNAFIRFYDEVEKHLSSLK